MKKFLSTFAIVAVTLAVFATGPIGPNPPQSGVVTFSGPSVQTNTVTFPYPYTVLPALILQAQTTNATPLTNTVITLTNFTLEVATSNVLVNWTAYAPYPRVESGTNALTAFTPVTNNFNPVYVYAPILNVEGSSTNNNAQPAITSVTSSNFVVSAAVTQTIYWGAFGPAYTPGTSTVTY